MIIELLCPIILLIMGVILIILAIVLLMLDENDKMETLAIISFGVGLLFVIVSIGIWPEHNGEKTIECKDYRVEQIVICSDGDTLSTTYKIHYEE